MIKQFKNKLIERVKPRTDTPIAGKPIILVVDDEPMVHRSLSEMCKMFGYTTAHAYHIKDVTSIIEKYEPRVVLLDIFMPGQNTFDMLQYFRQFPHLETVPIIVISGTNNTNAIASYLKEGADEFLLKPFHYDLLKVRIRSVLNRVKKATPKTASEAELTQLKEKNQFLSDELLALKDKHAGCNERDVGRLNAETEENLRVMINEASTRLTKAVADNQEHQGEFEHSLNNICLAMSTAVQLLKNQESSKKYSSEGK